MSNWLKIGRYGAAGLAVASGVMSGLNARRSDAPAGDEQQKEEKAGEQPKNQDRESGETGGGSAKDRNVVKSLRLIVNESIDVGVPLKTAYNQWTQFMQLPMIMRGVENIEQQGDDVLQWSLKVGPVRRRWTAEITEQNPDERIAWRSTNGRPQHRGAVTFHRLNGNLTRVQVEMEYFPHGIVEHVGNVFGVPGRRTRGNLRLFKHFLELSGSETGAWRGEISKAGAGTKQPSAGDE